MKRAPSTRLAARVSSNGPSETLFEVEEESHRQSKRVKLNNLRRFKLTSSTSTTVPDLEDGIQGAESSKAVMSERSSRSNVRTKGTRPPPKHKRIQQSLDTPYPAPAKWGEVYDMIKSMRALELAPVDTMGCQLAGTPETDPVAQRFSILVSLMLSSQTKDVVCDAAVKKLRASIGGSLTVDAILAADKQTISDAICQVGFWRKKTGFLKETAKQLREEFNSDVPKTVDELCRLPGVGPKMAFLTLPMAWNINVGVGVDVHVDRITNRLGWHTPSTLDHPEKTRLNLQSWLPKDLWYDINHKLVGFGQTICRPVNPHCDRCDINAAGLCPSASAKPKKRKSVVKGAARPKVEVAVEANEDQLEINCTPEASTVG